MDVPSDHATAIARFDAELVGAGKCGRNKKHDRGPCKNRAGQGTDHVGKGACYLHGGIKKGEIDRRVRSGIYSTVSDVRLKEILDELELMPNPLDVVPELNLARAILVDWTERFTSIRNAILVWNSTREPGDRPGRVPELQDLTPQLEAISRIVYRIERAQSDKYIPRGQFYRVMMAMGRAVDSRVDDEGVRKQIVDDWLRIEVP